MQRHPVWFSAAFIRGSFQKSATSGAGSDTWHHFQWSSCKPVRTPTSSSKGTTPTPPINMLGGIFGAGTVHPFYFQLPYCHDLVDVMSTIYRLIVNWCLSTSSKTDSSHFLCGKKYQELSHQEAAVFHLSFKTAEAVIWNWTVNPPGHTDRQSHLLRAYTISPRWLKERMNYVYCVGFVLTTLQLQGNVACVALYWLAASLNYTDWSTCMTACPPASPPAYRACIHGCLRASPMAHPAGPPTWMPQCYLNDSPTILNPPNRPPLYLGEKSGCIFFLQKKGTSVSAEDQMFCTICRIPTRVDLLNEGWPVGPVKDQKS